MNFKNIRITILLLILAYVAFDSFLSHSRATNWKHPLRVVIYPINADKSAATQRYISQLKTSQFDDIKAFMKREASRYGLALSTPIYIQLSQTIRSTPPPIPKNRSILNTMLWSLQLRYWSWKTDNYKGPKPQIRAYALYFDPKKHKGLAHSTGLKKGKLAMIQLFSHPKYTTQNHVIIMHELLHTLNATDKYKLSNNQPFFPTGYAEPQRKPRYPQRWAEIMGGRIPLSPVKARTPSSLRKVLIGPQTAKEIRWLK